MIIKNNFNNKSVNPLDDYNSIGKGSHSLDKELEKEKQGFIRENMKNSVLQNLRDEDNDNPDDRQDDKWDFFR